MKHLFKGIWSLEDYGKGTETDDMIKKAIINPQDFVLKPQKEGGGNNFFDETLKSKLLNIENEDELQSYLLMEKINPPMIPACHMRNGELQITESLSEMGIYSMIFTKNTASGNELICNKTIGTLMRTKASHFNEGGVAAGYSVID